jgi:hypothetical protein
MPSSSLSEAPICVLRSSSSEENIPSYDSNNKQRRKMSMIYDRGTHTRQTHTLLDDFALCFVFPLLVLSLFLAAAARTHAVKVALVLQMMVVHVRIGVALRRRVPLIILRHLVARRMVVVILIRI